jgi:hypothetical protein
MGWPLFDASVLVPTVVSIERWSLSIVFSLPNGPYIFPQPFLVLNLKAHGLGQVVY